MPARAKIVPPEGAQHSMEITDHGQGAVVAAASSGVGWPTAEGCANGEAIATEPRGHSPGAVYVRAVGGPR
jgi:hypothetical protein